MIQPRFVIGHNLALAADSLKPAAEEPVRGAPQACRERGELLRQRLFFRPPESGLTNRRWSA